MPIPGYAVLAGEVSDRRLATPKKNHYEIRVEAAGASYRIAVNVQSQDGSEVLYHVDEAFLHPDLTNGLNALANGRHPVVSQPNGLALDFVRGALGLKRPDFEALPFSTPGENNDLNDKIDHYVQRAMNEDGARIFAFGSSFTNPGKKDEYFNFKPAQGIHDVHMNQGNSGDFKKDDGIWQDGALLFFFPRDSRWVAVFLAFQNQAWQTDAQGHATTEVVITPPPPPPVHPEVSERIRIVAAMANSVGTPEIETVTLLNASPQDIAVEGWVLKDRNSKSFALTGSIASGNAVRVRIGSPMELSNKGGKITLFDKDGKVVDGVSYTKEQASKVGWTIVF